MNRQGATAAKRVEPGTALDQLARAVINLRLRFIKARTKSTSQASSALVHSGTLWPISATCAAALRSPLALFRLNALRDG